jgi:hypothetical protein
MQRARKQRTFGANARDALIDRLRQLDTSLIGALRDHADHITMQQLAAEADEELKPFRARMPAEEYEQSRRACIDRLLRESRRPAGDRLRIATKTIACG